MPEHVQILFSEPQQDMSSDRTVPLRPKAGFTGTPAALGFSLFFLFLFHASRSGDRRTGFQERLPIFIKPFEMRSK